MHCLSLVTHYLSEIHLVDPERYLDVETLFEACNVFAFHVNIAD